MVVLEELANDLLQLDLFALRHDQAIVRLGQEQHVVDYPRHALEVVEVRVQVVFIRLDIPFPGQYNLRMSHQIAHRRPQLVSDIRGEVREPHEGLIQPSQHGVE
ncbi:hypothetical protein D9M71_640690 [compost metagenome]